MDGGAVELVLGAFMALATLSGTALTIRGSSKQVESTAHKDAVSAGLVQVEIQQGQFKPAADVVSYMSNQNDRFLHLQAEDARKGRVLEATVEAIEEHEKWDKEILRAMRLMSRKLSEAGLGDVYIPRDPPPLSRHIRQAQAEDDPT